MKRFLILIGAILLGLTVRAQSVTYTCRYWFDRDTEQVTTTFTGNTAQMEWNVSMLTDGLHTLHVQMMDTAMVWSAPYNLFFIKTDAHPAEEMTFTYWFDRDIETRQTGNLNNGSLFINVEDLSDGLHTLHLAILGNSTNLTHNYLFVKLPVLQPESQLEYHCWFDQDYSTLVTGPVGDGYCMIDVSALPIGSHNMILQLADGTTLNILMDFDFHRDPMVLVTAEPEAGGTATGQLVDSICTVSATPNEGYDFVGWTHDGAVIATDPEMTFPLYNDTSFVATFQLRSYDIVATSNIAEGGTVTGSGTYYHFDECTLTATPAEGYRFHFWSENGELVSTDPTYTFTVNSARNVEAYFAWQGDTPEGAISGLFSIADGRQVYFSQGNLQYEKSTQTWSFMEHQYDVLGIEGEDVGEDHANVDVVSYFGWATSGCPLREDLTNYYYQPYNTYEGSGSNYGPSVFNADIFGEYINGDWGIYNAISNGGNVPAAWKTMTRPEWTYLFEDRANASSKWGRGNIDGINGVFLLPDEWTQPDGVAELESGSSSRFNTNNYALIDWLKMQAAGAVFLPAAGWRTGTEISEVNEWVSYWSTYGVDTQHARNLWVKNTSIDPNDQSYRHRGYPVRLVNYVTYNIGATPSPAEGGSIEGAGIYEQGTEITLTATPAEGYDFVGWTYDGAVIATDPEMSFPLYNDTSFVATFQLRSYDIVATANIAEGGTVTGGGTYHHFDQCTLTATPRTGYNFLGWYSDDELFTDELSFTFEVTAPAAFEARFEIQTFDITIAIDPENGGTVTGAGVYEYGTQCTLTATPAEGYLFQGWMRNNTLVSDLQRYTFTANADADFVAQFYAKGPGIEGYVTDGLIMHVDGIQNTRDGHSTTTNVWEDLVGFHDLTVSNYSSYTWEDNRFMGNGNGGHLNTGKQWKHFFQNNGDITIEIVTYIDCDRTYPEYRGLVGFHYGSDGMAIQNDQGGNRMVKLGQLPVTEADDNIATLSYTKTNGSFLNGEWKTNTTNLGGGVNSTYVAVIGNSWSPWNPVRGWNDSIYAVRIYNRTLTPAEIAQNHNVDAVRFGFAMFNITATADTLQGTVTGAGEYRIHRPCTLTATPNEGYCFKNWTENGEVVSTEAAYTFIVESDRELVANFLPLYDHTEALATGWNWWSTYIEQTGPDGLDMLENSIGGAGIRIQSRNDGYADLIEYQGSYIWTGSLQNLTNEQMYMIRTSEVCDATVTGPIADVNEHPIDLSTGWNWVGYPVEDPINLSNALSDLSPDANDMIKGRYGYSVYVVYQNNGFWYGTLNNLEPGKGYMYKSNSEMDKTFVYNTQRGGDLVENITTEGNTFQPADGDYAYNMTVTAVIDFGGEELRSADYELAAFVGDECRGSVRLIYVEPLGRYVAFLTVYGDTEEPLDFVLTDGEDLSWSADHIVYQANGIVGTLAAPAELHFSPLGVDETMGNVHVYPNPSNGVFNVSGTGVRKVEVVNAYGQVVYSLETKDDALRIDLSDMAAGTYLLRVVADGGVATHKLVKK